MVYWASMEYLYIDCIAVCITYLVLYISRSREATRRGPGVRRRSVLFTIQHR